MIDAKPAIVLIVERRELPQTIFGKDARVICETVREPRRREVRPFMRCQVVAPVVKP